MLRLAAHIRGADGLVGFLRVLCGGFVNAGRRRHIVLAVILIDEVARGVNSFHRKRDAVGTHIGDEADRLAADVHAFIKALGDAHRARRAEAELAGGFLL